MHKWIALTLFPRSDLRPIRRDELIIMFAMVRKIKISPVKCMIRQWLESIKFSALVECTSLITRLAKGLGVVSNQIAFISAARPRIDPRLSSARAYFETWSRWIFDILFPRLYK
jgi:hypothetical protein